MITVGSGATFGYAVVSAIDSNTVLSIHDTDNFVSGITTVAAGAGYFVSQELIYTLGDSTYDAPESKTTGFSTSPVFTGVFGVDRLEVGVAATTAYAVAHQGWVGVTTAVKVIAGQGREKLQRFFCRFPPLPERVEPYVGVDSKSHERAPKK